MIGNREAIHPTDDRLAAFALGRLDEGDAASLADHLGGCETCQQAIRAVPDDSILALLRPSGGTPLPQSPLQGVTTDDVAPPDHTAPPGGLMLVPGYEVKEELGRGGMGVVYKARHLALKRDVALKMIRDGAFAGPAALTRFRTEAQALARLQHPNIVQVHEVGEFAGRPFFSLEFCTGGSLDKKLNGTPLLPQEAARLVEVLARAMHAAHQHEVVHRDLKPANVLLTADGAAKLTDFGLAKKLDEVGVTQSGAILGTPSYMAPEQAAGKQKEVGPLSDVYALGAILYECLTGRPPFKAATVMDTLAQVLADDPVPPRQLQSRTPRDLETICLKCLQKEPGKRYATAADLAEDLRRFQAGEPIRARPVGVVERAWRWCKRYPSRAGLAAAVLLAVVAATAGGIWYQQDRAGRAAEHALKAGNTERDVTGALQQASAFAAQAAGLHDDPTKWEAVLVEAQSALDRADGVLNSGVDDTGRLRPRVDAAQADLAAAERDRRMIAGLEAARFQWAEAGKEGAFDEAGAVALYAAAFRQDKPGWDSLEAGEAAAHINRRAIREDLLAALDDWAHITANKDEAKRLQEIVRAADPDPGSLRNRCRALLDRKDWDGLRRLLFGREAKEAPTARLVSVGRQLLLVGGASEAVKFFKEAKERRPSDFWIAFELANASAETKPPATDEAIRYFTAALMLRPNSAAVHTDLGIALWRKHRLDEAIAEHRQALEIQPNLAAAHSNLGDALHDKHQLDDAIAEYRTALQIRADYAETHNNLGLTLQDKHQLDDAIAEYRQALQIQPDFAEAHNNLGNAFYDKHQLDDAIAEYRMALQIRADSAEAHNNLGRALQDKHQLDDAITEYRQALQIQPDFADAHYSLGSALGMKGQLDEAIVELRQALQIQPDDARAHYNLGSALFGKRRLDEAIPEFRQALQIKADYADAHNALGRALQDKGRLDEAIPEFRQAIKIQPDLADAHRNLGDALCGKQQFDDAIAEYRQAIKIQPDNAGAHSNLGAALTAKGQFDEAIAEHRIAIQIQPGSFEAHYSLGTVLGMKGRFDEAIAEFRQALQIRPDDARAHCNLGNALCGKQQFDDAIVEYRKTLQIAPEVGLPWCQLGRALRARGRFAESLAAFRRGHQLGSQDPQWNNPSGQWVREAEGLVERDAVLPAILRGEAEPADAVQQTLFADFCQRYKRLDATASRFYADAFAAQPGWADDLRIGARFNAACAAALAGCGQGEDAAKTDAKERGRWRRQALDWLRADLALWTKAANGANPQGRAVAAQVLQHWKEDADLASVRGADALAKRPAEERDAWGKLWADVDAVRRKAQEK